MINIWKKLFTSEKNSIKKEVISTAPKYNSLPEEKKETILKRGAKDFSKNFGDVIISLSKE
jgi:hypothetical protein